MGAALSPRRTTERCHYRELPRHYPGSRSQGGAGTSGRPLIAAPTQLWRNSASKRATKVSNVRTLVEDFRGKKLSVLAADTITYRNWEDSPTQGEARPTDASAFFSFECRRHQGNCSLGGLCMTHKQTLGSRPFTSLAKPVAWKPMRSEFLRWHQVSNDLKRPTGLMDDIYDELLERLGMEPCVTERDQDT